MFSTQAFCLIQLATLSTATWMKHQKVQNSQLAHVYLRPVSQVAMQANVPQPNMEEEEGDDVDEELKKLQMALEGGGGTVLNHSISFKRF